MTIRISLQVGWSIGPVIVIYISQTINIETGFRFMGGCAALGFIILLIFRIYLSCDNTLKDDINENKTNQQIANNNNNNENKQQKPDLENQHSETWRESVLHRLESLPSTGSIKDSDFVMLTITC